MKMFFQQTQDGDESDSQQQRNLRVTTGPLKIALGTGLCVVVLYAFGNAGGTSSPYILTALRMMGMGLFAAGAFLGLGLLLGFIFGVPRSAQETAAPAAPAPATGAPTVGGDKQRLKVNTNLEQISDWLTKILVGVGLTQLSDIPTKLNELAGFIAKGLGGTDADRLFATGVVLYFFVCGFFSGYLLTRLFLAGAFLIADNMAEEATREAQKAQGAVESLRMEVLSGVAGAAAPAQAVAGVPGQENLEAAAPGIPLQNVLTWPELAEQYNVVRKEEKPSYARTRAMSSIFNQMCRLSASSRDYDPRPQLQEVDGGRRLFAYAYLSTRPDPALLGALVDSVTSREDTNFGQYYGIKAIGEVLAKADSGAAASVVARLGSFLQKLERDSDRYYELHRILREWKEAAKPIRGAART